MQYSLDEICLKPAILSKIKSRKDVNPFSFETGNLPIFVAPMTCIVDNDNFYDFDNYFTAIRPIRYNSDIISNIKTALPSEWTAVSLNDFKTIFLEHRVPLYRGYSILIDCANGHMKEIYEVVKKAKKDYFALRVMIGNIANPLTYLKCCRYKIDYVRVGIGGGSGCTTSVQTGFHSSMPYLLTSINIVRKIARLLYLKTTKVVADGGINTVSKAVKCLALGADYVMMGSMFARCEESCGDGEYYGQASEKGQLDRFGIVMSHPEGCSIPIKKTTTTGRLAYEIEAVLRSAMSYAGAEDLKHFIGKVRWGVQSELEFKAYNK